MKEYLLKLGFKIDTLGFEYWIRAIEIYKENYWRYGFTMQFLYNEIAKEFNSTDHRVERCLRTSSALAKKKIAEIYNYKLNITTKTILQLICIIGVIENE